MKFQENRLLKNQFTGKNVDSYPVALASYPLVPDQGR